MSTSMKVWALACCMLFISMTSCNYDGPSDRPPNWVRTIISSDPSSSMTIGWHKYSGAKGDDRIYLDTVDHGDDISSYAFEYAPSNYTKMRGINSAFLQLEDLEPETKYYFIIVNSYGVSARYYFETLSDDPNSKFSIISGGDSRNNRTVRRNANRLVSKLNPHFVMFGGDMTDRGTGNQWADWFSDWELTHRADGRVIPIIPARGNHEKNNAMLARLFLIPANNYYGVNIGGDLLKIYTLNSEMSTGGDQLGWLKSSLAKDTNFRWKFAQYHKPMRPHVGRKSEGSSEYKNWANVFYEYQMDLVMESDSHSVKSTWPLRPSTEEGHDEGFVRDDETGTVYVGEGCWGAPLRDADDTKSWTRASGKFNQFKLMYLDNQGIELRTIKVDNAEDVGTAGNDEHFLMPENLDVWQPSSGEVIVIE
jgi:hypothetical protein